MKPRKIPQRMCIGCQQMHSKRELVRVVRTPEGDIGIDSTGKRSGRGAYVCPNIACLQLARKAKRLQRALEGPISDAIWDELEATIASMPSPISIKEVDT